MGLFDGWKVDRAIARAHAQLVAGQGEAGWAAADEAVKLRGADALVKLADRLVAQEQRGLAREAIERALELDPDGWNTQAALADWLVNGDAAEVQQSVEVYRRLHAKDPEHEGVARVLAKLVLDEHPDEAVKALAPFVTETTRDLDLRKLLGTAQFAAGQAADAVETLLPVVQYLDDAERQLMSGGYDTEWKVEVHSVYSNALAEAEGDEALIVDEAMRRRLDANAGVNFRLLAGAQMAKSGRVAPVLELRSVEETEAEGKRRLEANPKDPVGLCQLGSALLRKGQLGKAQKQFVSMQEVDKTHFGASRGIGAVMDHEHYRLRERALRFDEVGALPDGLTEVVPDWAALTELERRVVRASVRPFDWILPTLARHRMRMRILPVDVRTVDLPEFAELAAVRAEDDHRSYAAIAGLAGHDLACATIEELLDVTHSGWVFGHEFAHLVHRVLPDDAVDRIGEIWDAAGSEELEHELTQYEHRNEFEFFAVAYTAYLAVHNGGDAGREILPGTPLDQVFELIEALAEDEDAPNRTVPPRKGGEEDGEDDAA